MTTAPAPISASFPTVTPPITIAPDPIVTPLPIVTGALPVVVPCKVTVLIRRLRELVVDEHHPVADEHAVADPHAVADERVALDLAALADHSSALNLDERADARSGTDAAAVEIREREDDDTLAELDVGDEPVRRLVRRLQSHRGRLLAMPQTSFTFVLPTLNAAGPLFERALASIRAQDYPPELLEILVADGGSTDTTRSDAERHGARVIENPNRLAEWGVKEGMLVAAGEVVIVFASDNDFVGTDWLSRVARQFEFDPELAAVYGRLVSGDDDSALNKYVALIQSEPLNWFLNRNLETYLAVAPRDDDGFARFTVLPTKPLVWGANGLAVRRSFARPVWERAGYVADVDAFHAMVVAGHARVAYDPGAYVFHHQVATLGDYRRKWRRNAVQHLVEQSDDRRLDWVMVEGFRRRAVLWGLYSVIPVFSGADAVRRASRDRSVYWLYHPVVTFLQAVIYAQALTASGAGRDLLRQALSRRD